MNKIQQFTLLGGPCPICGAMMKLRAEMPVDGNNRWKIQWYCDKHSTIEGKPVRQPMCALVIENITHEEFIVITNAVKGLWEIDPSQIPLVEAEVECYDAQLGISNAFLQLGELFGISVTDYLSSNGFDFAPWFKVLVSKMDREAIQAFRALPSLQIDSALTQQMREVLDAALCTSLTEDGANA